MGHQKKYMFTSLLDEMVINLNLIVNQDEKTDFNLYDHSDLEYIEDHIESLSMKELNFYQELILQNKSFYILGSKKYYCSNYSINKLSGLIGIHLFNCYLTSNGISIPNLKTCKNENKFFYFLWSNIFSYSFAKIINPHKKCNLYLDWKKELIENKYSKNDKKLILDALTFLEDPDIAFLKGLKSSYIYRISEIVGDIIGENLINKFTSQNNDFSSIHQLLNDAELNFEYYIEFIYKLLPNNLFKMQRKKYY